MQFLLFFFLLTATSCQDRKVACLIGITLDTKEKKEYIKKKVKPVGEEYKCEVDIIDGLKYSGYEVYKALHEYLKKKGVEVCPLVPPEQKDCY